MRPAAELKEERERLTKVLVEHLRSTGWVLLSDDTSVDFGLRLVFWNRYHAMFRDVPHILIKEAGYPNIELLMYNPLDPYGFGPGRVLCPADPEFFNKLSDFAVETVKYIKHSLPERALVGVISLLMRIMEPVVNMVLW